MAALLVAMSIMAVMLAVAMPVWKQMTQREKEEELIFRGKQYVHAIGLFQRKYAGAYPPTIDVLVNEHFLRKKFKDPITNDDFVPITQSAGGAPGTGTATSATPGQIANRPPSNQTVAAQPQRGSTGSVAATPGFGATTPAPGGPTAGIAGVTSKSSDKSIRLYNGRGRYNEWAFLYTAQMQAPGAATPGAVPGAVPGTVPGDGRGTLPDFGRGRGRGTSDGRGAPPPGGRRGFTSGFGPSRGSGR